MKNINDYIVEQTTHQITKTDLSNKLSELKFEEIKNVQDLYKIVNKSDKKSNKGFWLFKEALDKDKTAYGNINKDPWYIQYYAVKYEDNIIGLISYSLQYDEENYEPSLHIFDIQTLAEYKGVSKVYFIFFEKIAKKNNKKYLTLKCYEDSLQTLYKKYGFEVSDKEDNVMYKKI